MYRIFKILNKNLATNLTDNNNFRSLDAVNVTNNVKIRL